MSAAQDPLSRRRILRVDAEGRMTWLTVDTGKRPRHRLEQALERSTRHDLWLLPDAGSIDDLLGAIGELYRAHPRLSRPLGSLLALEPGRPAATPVLDGLFEPVIGVTGSFKHLPEDELIEVLTAGTDVARDLILGGWAHAGSAFLVLVRGDLERLVVPFATIPGSGSLAPNFRNLSFTDHGQTVRLGEFEVSTDALLYEFDADYRRRLNADRRAAEQGFGPALRRLRKQRGLARTDFPGVNAKTLARIERGEIERPRERTLALLEERLGVSREEIGSF